MSTTRQCPYCGAEQDPGERFCARCGNQYPFEDQGEPADPAAPTTVVRSVRSPWYRTLPFLGAVLLGVVLLGYGLFRFGVAYLETGRPDPAAGSGPVLAASPTRPPGSPIAAASPSPVVIQPSPPPAEATARARVGNTEGQGANLRQRPSTSAPVVKSLPDGTIVDVIGPDQQAEGRAWRNVRDAEGASGWVAAELLGPE